MAYVYCDCDWDEEEGWSLKGREASSPSSSSSGITSEGGIWGEGGTCWELPSDGKFAAVQIIDACPKKKGYGIENDVTQNGDDVGVLGKGGAGACLATTRIKSFRLAEGNIKANGRRRST